MTLYALRDDSCVLHLPMNEGEGSVVYDHSRYGNNGQIVGANWTIGKFGMTLSFDGVDDYVDCGNDESLNSSEITVEAWIKPNSSQPRKWYMPLGKGDYANSGWYFEADKDTGQIHFVVYDPIAGSSAHSGYASGVTLNQWHHIVGKFDGENIYIIVDGTYKSSEYHPNADPRSSEPLRIGIPKAYGGFPAPWKFNGLIDEVRIYNRALSEEEIKSLYLYYQNFEVRPCILCPRPTI